MEKLLLFLTILFCTNVFSQIDYKKNENLNLLFSKGEHYYFKRKNDSIKLVIKTFINKYKKDNTDSILYYKLELLKSASLILEKKSTDATDKLLKSLTFFNNKKDSLHIAKTYYLWGDAIYYIRNREKAKKYYKKALQLDKFLPNSYLIKTVQNINTCNLEIIQRAKKEFSNKKYNDLITQIIKKYDSLIPHYIKTENLREVSRIYSLIAGCYSEKKQPKKALFPLEKAIYYAKEKNDSILEAFAIVKKCQTLNYLKKHKLALKLIQKAKKIYSKTNDLGMLLYVYVVEKESLSSLKKYKEASLISDTIFNISVKKYDLSFADKMTAYEAKFKTSEKEKELLQTKAEKATTELELNNQKQLTYGLFGGLAILLLAGFSIFQRNKRKHQLAIANQKEQNLQSIIFAEEKERTKIARDLHDGIVQQIGATILKSRTIFDELGIADEAASKKILDNFEASNKELREISHQMMPRALEEAGLITALRHLFENSLHPSNIKYDFEHQNINKRLPKNIEITLYRITQELINNILKHSKASEVNIQLFKTENDIIYMIEDNGTGFSSTKKEGIGLKNIKSRIDLIKGIVNFSTENTGTLTTIKIPL